MVKLIAFETEDDLQKLTGLNHNELWEHDFDLDDWDIGFQSEIRLHNVSEESNSLRCDEFDWDSPCYWLLRQMSNYCTGMKYTEYKNKHYYMVYH